MKLNVHRLQTKLQHWFQENKRDLPWRFEPAPYQIWISEIMLQQTKASVVIPYYTRFLQLFPTIEALACASENRVLKAWEGLGYYSRARNLQKGAKYICERYNGQFPQTYDEILSIPGIGPYTAGAIASFAFKQKEAAIDGNVLRVFARLLEEPWDRTKQKDRNNLAAWMHENIFKNLIIPVQTWNEACIELGALVCTPQSPACQNCPWLEDCKAQKSNRVAQFPTRQNKKVLPEEIYTVLILKNKTNGKYLVHRRPSEGLLSSLWEFPMIPGDYSLAGLQDISLELGISTQSWQNPGHKKHVFSHKIWRLQFYCLSLNNPEFERLTKALIACQQEEQNFQLYISSLSAQSYTVLEETIEAYLPSDWRCVSGNELKSLPFSSAFTEVRDMF